MNVPSFAALLAIVSLLGCTTPPTGDPGDTSADADGVVQALLVDSFSARFYDRPLGGSRIVDGPCVVARSMVPAPLVAQSAGEVRVSGRAECIASPDGSLEYFCLGTSALYVPGDLVTVAATGATFPAFTAQVTAPSPGMEVTSMVQPDTSVVIGWAGGSGRALVIAGASSATESVFIECAVDSAVGTITVPSTVIAELRAVSATAPLTLTFVERRWVDVEGRRVLVEVGFYGGTF